MLCLGLMWAAMDGSHWLGKLGLIETPPGTVLRSASLSFRGGLPWWLALVALLLSAGLAVFFYLRESAKLSLPLRLVFALLRTALIGLVLVLLMRPVLLAEFAGERPRSIVVLVDNSVSMQRADRRTLDADRVRAALALGHVPLTTPITETAALQKLTPEQLQDPTRKALVEAVLKNTELNLLDGLGQKGPVRAYLFDRQLRSAAREGLTDSLAANGSQTALADALHRALTRLSDESPAAVVVISDGVDNASERTLEEVTNAYRDQGVPLHIWGVGSSESGTLELVDARLPGTVFIDDKQDVKDDVVEVPVRFRCRGIRKGTVVLTFELGDQKVTETFPVAEGENLMRTLRLQPKKGRDRERKAKVSIRLQESPDVGAEKEQMVQVKNARIKVLYIEGTPRREYMFIQPVLNRDRRLLLRLLLVEGDPELPDLPPDRESGAKYIKSFPRNFPEPTSTDPDQRPYDLVILGDAPYKTLGNEGATRLKQFVKEGGGLVILAGPQHCPAEYVSTPLEEVFPVEFTRMQFSPEMRARLSPFKPVLTYEGEQSVVTSLADRVEENRKLWEEDLWQYQRGFWWHYPVTGLRSGARALVVHPKKLAGKKPTPILATQYYGKGEVLFLGTDETWRWRDSTGDQLTARFWGQIVAQFGLPHLLGNSRRTQVALERGRAVLGQPSGVQVRLLDQNYDPVTRAEVEARLVPVGEAGQPGAAREVILRRVPGQPGQYRGSLPNDTPGRHELVIPGTDHLQKASLPFRVELPPRHEREKVGMNERALRTAARTSGGAFYREEDLIHLVEQVEARQSPFTLRQEVILWGRLALLAFVLLVSVEWLLRKVSNLS